MLILDELEDRKHVKPEWEPPYAASMIRYMRRCDVTYVFSSVPRSFAILFAIIIEQDSRVLMADEMYLQKASE